MAWMATAVDSAARVAPMAEGALAVAKVAEAVRGLLEVWEERTVVAAVAAKVAREVMAAAEDPSVTRAGCREGVACEVASTAAVAIRETEEARFLVDTAVAVAAFVR